MEQPKDYVDPIDEVGKIELQSWDEFLEEQYATMTMWERVLLKLQDHIILVIVTAILCGYLAGVHFGESWILSLFST